MISITIICKKCEDNIQLTFTINNISKFIITLIKNKREVVILTS